MQKSNARSPLSPTLQITVTAMLVAISIICGKFLAISSDIMRFSFENLPIFISSVIYGPFGGLLCAVAADLIGCVLRGYQINVIVTLGGGIIGFASGLLFKVSDKLHLPLSLKVTVGVAISHILGSVIIKTFGLAAFYGMPIHILMLWRLLNYLIVGAIEGALLYVLMKNKSISSFVNSLRVGGEGAADYPQNDFTAYANSFQAVTVPGLERIGALCELLENPQDELKFIHVAGTNGKGSVCANIASILTEAGFVTGKYISPNLIKVNERISVNGNDIDDADLNRILKKIEPLSKEVEAKLGLAPTQFEIWTAAAFLYFYEQKCDYVVLEVGLGGEFDATNIIKSNELAIITRLDIDHTQYLGTTLGEVAKAKAGIIKEKSGTGTVITVEQAPEAMAVIKKEAALKGCKLTVAHPKEKGHTDVYETFDIGSLTDIKCGISGYHQIENASLAVLAALALGIDEDTIRRGVSLAKNPARFELIEKNPPIIYDGGHNENGIRALTRSLERYFGQTERVVVFACMSDKEIGESLRLLDNGKCRFIFTTVKDNPRAATANETQARAKKYGITGDAFEDIGEAYEAAKRLGKLTVICGSLYLYKDLCEYLEKNI